MLYIQVWQPTADEAGHDAGRETLAEQLALEVLACPQGSVAKSYVAALCKVRTRSLGVLPLSDSTHE